jgi:hypothetical protein
LNQRLTETNIQCRSKLKATKLHWDPSPRHKHPTGVSQTLAGHSAQEREDRVLLKAGMEQMHARKTHE